MELIQLRYFLIVAQLEHITQAAEILHISQPSLSRTISRLENELGVKLFNRQGRQIKLNEYGTSFQIRVKKIFKEIDNGIDEIKNLSSSKKQTISIAVSSARIVSDLLIRFAKQHPEIYLRQTLVPTNDMAHLLETRKVDFCISTSPVEHPEVEFLPLIEEEVFLGVSLSHPLAKCKSILLKDVANEAFISLIKGYGLREITDSFCEKAGFSPNIMFEVDDPSSIGAFVLAGLGVAFIPEPVFHHYKSLPIVKLQIKEPICRQTIGLYWNKDRYFSKALFYFSEFIKSYFETLKYNHPKR
ncbi:LysR family transcriptional regulator [Clostridium saccharoperbutylacetonicum]|uniref:LysR family transcriptional regulator n=1 Tax=Clostridium saccharoperbutylacetonicum TaxID=36745 RepID=UPI000983AC6C|nr:LysR family transcriptional regulator [Clostridium saccharoperbutylacetonicum]AQR96860.1 HTH-type transcriptional regulator GltC [Clostridium saccharoperbutylacetonicum]NSB32738.1 DNA-binding transcriptional LysR family regulator [Clostridium saccharoperbutylacetonicum]